MACFATAKVIFKGVAHTVRRIHIPVGLTSDFSAEASFFEKKTNKQKVIHHKNFSNLFTDSN